MIITAHLLALLAAPHAPVTEVHHGVRVVDRHRWLEDGKDPEVDAWTRARHAEARTMLDALPLRAAVADRLRAIYSADRESWGGLKLRGELRFVLHRPPGAQQPILKVFPGDRTLLDPLAEDPTGKTHIDWYRPSPDGAVVAVSLSKAGTESGDVHLLRTATGMPIAGEVVPRVNGGTAGGDLAWAPDGRSFHYTRYPRPAERPEAELNFHQQLWRHTLGQPDDTYVLGKELPKTAQIRFDVGPGRRLLATVQHGDSGVFELHRTDDGAKWTKIAAPNDGIVQGTWAPDGGLFLISRKGAPKGQIVRHRGGVVVPEGADTIISNFYASPTMVATADRLFVGYQLGGPSTVRAFDHAGHVQPALPIPPVSAVSSLQPVGGDLVLHVGSFTDAGGWYRLTAGGQLKPTKFVDRSGVRFDDVDVVRELAPSKDGTKVPVNILRPKGAPVDGTGACVVTGYGGYGLSLAPRFRDSIRVLLDHGVCFAVANLRGGGEFGATWHSQGRLTDKQNVFDDFAGVLEHLAARKYASAKRIAIIGGSNGGLLMGATLTQRSDLPAAVASFVGIYDMLRVELSPNGVFNIPEFGTVKDAAQFRALHAYSPYHHVTTSRAKAKAYPPTLLLTGANDPRVDPMQSRKFLARLHAAGATGRAWLRVSFTSGHGGGAKLDERIAQSADAYSFLLHHLGVQLTADVGRPTVK